MSFLLIVLTTTGLILPGGCRKKTEEETPLLKSPTEDLVQAQLISDVSAVAAGKPFTLAVLYKIRPEWHIYWENPGESGLATTVQFTVPEGFTVTPRDYPLPVRFDQAGDIIGYGYFDTVMLLAQVEPPQELPLETPLEFSADTNWLACKDVCVPEKARLSLSLPVKGKAEPSDHHTLIQQWTLHLPQAYDPSVSPFQTSIKVNSSAQNKSSDLTLQLRWSASVQKIECFSKTPDSHLLDKLSFSTQGKQTTIRFTIKEITPAQTAPAPVKIVIAYQPSDGSRRGVMIPIPIPPT